MVVKSPCIAIIAMFLAGLLHSGLQGQDSLNVPFSADTVSKKITGAPVVDIIPAAPVSANPQVNPSSDSTLPIVEVAEPQPEDPVETADSIAEADSATPANLPPALHATVVAGDSAIKDRIAHPAATASAIPGSDTDSRREKSQKKQENREDEIMAGYGSMKNDEVTGAVVSINSDNLTKDAVFSVRKALQGRAAGVNIIQNSGHPGKPMTVFIRGVGTINSNNPLYIVDGTPVGDIDFLSPEDIELITVLKDGSSAAIYGARGANGVILVTTKSPKEDESEISYDMYFGTQQAWKGPSLCNAKQWATLNNLANKNSGDDFAFRELAHPESLGVGTDWWNAILNKNAIIQSQSVSVAKSEHNLKYYISGGYFRQDGIIKGSDYERATFRLNTEAKIADWISVGKKIGITRSKTNNLNELNEWNSAIINAYCFLPTQPLMDPKFPQEYSTGEPFNNAKNPVGVIAHNNSTTSKTSIVGILYSDMELFKALNLRAAFGIDMGFNDSSAFIPTFNSGSNDKNANSSVTRRTSTDNLWNFENTVSFQKMFWEYHSVKIFAGVAALAHKTDFVLAQNSITPSDDSSMRYLDATQSLSPTVGGVAVTSSLASAFGRLEYDYANRYILNANYRRDGSSRFGPANRWGDFTSIAGAWRISQECFMNSVPFISELKLRAGWGKTGNQDIPDFSFVGTSTDKADYVFGNSIFNGMAFLNSGNKQLHWEGQSCANLGLDWALFGRRIEFSCDIYKKTTTGMLVCPPIPGMAGFMYSVAFNEGMVQNKGGEFTLSWNEKLGEFLSSMSINFSAFRNKVLSTGEYNWPINDASFRNMDQVTRTEVGHSLGGFYGYKTNGLFQTQGQIDSFTWTEKGGKIQKVQPNAKPGDVRYVDANHDGEWDKGYLGSPYPKFSTGFTINLQYKGFDLNGMFSVVYGNKIFNGTRYYTDNSNAYWNLSTRMLNSWSGPGSTNDVMYPRLNVADGNNTRVSDRFIEDGSYGRLKSLQLGYTLDPSITKKLWVKKCRIYIGGENLLTFTNYTGLDPEVGIWGATESVNYPSLSVGIDRGIYPQARSFIIGLNITL
jgi:TonB-linked SusC/RagA family outer membrane protein